MTQFNPWLPDEREDFPPLVTYGQASLAIEQRTSANGRPWRLIHIQALPLDLNLGLVKRSTAVFSKEYNEVVLPSLQGLQESNPWLKAPMPDPDGSVPPWEFWCAWQLSPYRDYRADSVKWFKDNPKEDGTTSVLTDEKGKEYVDRTTIEFVEAFQTEAECNAAWMKAYPDANDYTRNVAVQSSGPSVADKQFLRAFVSRAFGGGTVLDNSALKTALEDNNLPFDLDDPEVALAMADYLVNYAKKDGKVDEAVFTKLLSQNFLTEHLTASSVELEELVTSANNSPF